MSLSLGAIHQDPTWLAIAIDNMHEYVSCAFMMYKSCGVHVLMPNHLGIRDLLPPRSSYRSQEVCIMSNQRSDCS